MTRKPTINDVAKLANVSVTTVSLALSGKGRISQSTINNINQAIKSLGYVRNKNAAMLRSGLSATIGVIVRDIQDPFYASVIAGINDILTERDYVTFLLQSKMEKISLSKCTGLLAEHGVSGIILCYGGTLAHNVKSLAEQQNIPLVVAAQSTSLDDIDIVRADNRLGAKLATEFLINKGHRNIAYLGGDANSLTLAERVAGFGYALNSHGLKFKPSWVVANNPTEQNQNFESLLKQNPNITAFLCHDNQTTLTLIFNATKLGRVVGNGGLSSYLESQIEIFNFSTPQYRSETNQVINYVDNNPREIGKQAANQLLHNSITSQIIITPKLILSN